MADLTTLERIQTFVPSVTEFKFAMARKHKLQYGRGIPLPLQKSPRMRVKPDQLDHFLTFITSPHIIQDLPFGQRYLKLSSGKVVETPNVIRTLIPQRIVKQYEQYCNETNYKPFGSSTMLRILSCCSATVRKSLQGLDYIAAEGAKGFDDLHRILDRLGECGLGREAVSQYQKSLKEAKQYLKSDYKVYDIFYKSCTKKKVIIRSFAILGCMLKMVLYLFQVHVVESSTIADHCSTYALSDSKEDLFTTLCNHAHDERCLQCEMLKDVLESTENCFVDCALNQDERDDLMYCCRQAIESIKSWKAHQLRSCRQDEARTSVLDKIDENSVHVTLDWAMKFLPQNTGSLSLTGLLSVEFHSTLVWWRARSKSNSNNSHLFISLKTANKRASQMCES